MNWKEIENRYPKANRLWMESDYSHWRNFVQQSGDDVLKNRNLYDFFDEQGIRIGIDITSTGFIVTFGIKWGSHAMSLIKSTKNKWRYGFSGIMYVFKTRLEAEEAAFIKASEILEEKLNRNE